MLVTIEKGRFVFKRLERQFEAFRISGPKRIEREHRQGDHASIEEKMTVGFVAQAVAEHDKRRVGRSFRLPDTKRRR